MMALGGQGGGVLTKWLVDLAEHNGYLAQSTYVAGVAQRTGATVYCVEMFPKASAEAAGRAPVFTPYPVPGDVELVVAGEMAETGRAIQKGFVTPNITTLIASSHRVYSVTEKSALGDGIIDQAPIAAAAGKASKAFICFDMDALALSTRSVISAVLFGAIAGSGALPFARDAFEAAIRRSGRAVDSNLGGFSAGFEKAISGERAFDKPPVDDIPVPELTGKNSRELEKHISGSLPEELAPIAIHGALRTLDYQDRAYADDYVKKLSAFVALDNANEDYRASCVFARHLALQMCYEDTLRVASLKVRPERFQRIRRDLNVAAEAPVHIVEYFHPRFEEICDALPNRLGRRLRHSERARRWLSPLFSKGRNLTTTSLSGFLPLSFLSAMQRFRRGTYRFHEQQALIDDWVARISEMLPRDYELGLALCELIEILRGYGDTYERGLTRYRRIMSLVDSAEGPVSAGTVRKLLRAAQADEAGLVFESAINEELQRV